jgi:putative ABC transport system substrate-binding protein
MIGRREFIAGLGGAAAWPFAARAQHANRVRRIGVLMPGDENDPQQKLQLSAFTQALADLGWADGRNARIDLRWHGGDNNRMRALAQELVGLQPDIIVTPGTPATVAVQRETSTIPIVFAAVSDPVGSGLVARLDRPTGNITGFALLEASRKPTGGLVVMPDNYMTVHRALRQQGQQRRPAKLRPYHALKPWRMHERYVGVILSTV